MDYYYNIESFDITQQIQQYKGKKLEEVFQNQRTIKNQMGEFIELKWVDDNFPLVDLGKSKRNIIKNLKTVYYIGENIENYLFRRGIRDLIDLKAHLRYSHSANKILNLIHERNYKKLNKNRYVCDLDVVFCFDLEEILFLDIETLGIYDSPMIIVGVGYYKNKRFHIDIFFARELEEEIAICDHLRKEILPNFKCFISYNGKTFDIPYIANRFLYYFDKNPMISEDEIPYENVNTKYHHIDLYHNCRRKFKGSFSDYTLTNMEQELLKLERKNKLPSNLVGTCYRKYLKNPEKYIGLIKECVEHNYYDIYTLPLILRKILQE
ncbi:MAG: ribonuclease H-like domain-containing protein [Promethearchaeota archaeon]